MGLSKNKTSSMILLSVLIPVSLLATFRLVGIVPEPPQAATVNVNAVYWNMNRPWRTIPLDEVAQNLYLGKAGISLNFTVKILAYKENWPTPPFNGHDGLDFQTDACARTKQGYIKSILVSFKPDEPASAAFLDTNEYALKASNATITRRMWLGTEASEAYVIAEGSAASASLTTQLGWVFMDENLMNHRLKLTFEARIFNGSVNEVVIIPIVLAILATNESP